MPRIRLGEETVRLFNPLPSVTVREIIEEAGLIGLRRPTDEQQFRLDYQWSSGVERENMTLEPGEYISVPISLARAIVKRHGDHGILYLRDKTSPARQFEEIIEALHKALGHYQTNGSIGLERYMQRNSYDRDKDWNIIKSQLPGKVSNTFKEKRIQKLIDKLVKVGIDARVMHTEPLTKASLEAKRAVGE